MLGVRSIRLWRESSRLHRNGNSRSPGGQLKNVVSASSGIRRAMLRGEMDFSIQQYTLPTKSDTSSSGLRLLPCALYTLKV